MDYDLDPFYIKQEINRKNSELFSAQLKSQHSTRYTENPDLNRWKARELQEDIAVLRAKLEVIERLKRK